MDLWKEASSVSKDVQDVRRRADIPYFRRYGAVEGGRFCFEGGTRCGKGEGLHVLRIDNSEELQVKNIALYL